MNTLNRTEISYAFSLEVNEFKRPEWLDDSMFDDDPVLVQEAERLGRSYKDTVFVDRNIVVRNKTCMQVYHVKDI